MRACVTRVVQATLLNGRPKTLKQRIETHVDFYHRIST